MHVGIDISSVMYDRGVSRYTANLVRALAARPDIDLSLYGASFRQAATLEKFVQEVKRPYIGTRRKIYSQIQKSPPTVQELMWNTLHLNPVRKMFPAIDVFHSWDWLQPPDKDLPLVSTIHDLAILKYPDTAHPKILKLHQQSWATLKQRNAQIIAVSKATKQDIVEQLEIPAHNVHVIYEALPAETVQVTESLSEDTAEEIKQRLQLDRPYLLFVGTREPRKNLMRLIKAWEPLSKHVDLLIAGAAGWDETSTDKVLKNEHLRFLGHVSNEELAVLYGEAVAFCYPSLYEGFGLPILEAFYHGTPVITSNLSSMIEVAGNAAEFVDPHSISSISKGIATILHETPEQQQKRLQKMIIRLHQFSWTRVAEETIKVYHRAVES